MLPLDSHLSFSAAWEKQRLAKPKVVTEAEIREEPPSDPSLACGICSTLLSQAVRTPCCDARFCEECIQAHLLENDFKCPKCAKNVGSLDRLEVDRGAREKVGEYIKTEIERRRDEDDETVKEETKVRLSLSPLPVKRPPLPLD
jgi:protein MPE1